MRETAVMIIFVLALFALLRAADKEWGHHECNDVEKMRKLRGNKCQDR